VNQIELLENDICTVFLGIILVSMHQIKEEVCISSDE